MLERLRGLLDKPCDSGRRKTLKTVGKGVIAAFVLSSLGAEPAGPGGERTRIYRSSKKGTLETQPREALQELLSSQQGKLVGGGFGQDEFVTIPPDGLSIHNTMRVAYSLSGLTRTGEPRTDTWTTDVGYTFWNRLPYQAISGFDLHQVQTGQLAWVEKFGATGKVTASQIEQLTGEDYYVIAIYYRPDGFQVLLNNPTQADQTLQVTVSGSNPDQKWSGSVTLLYTIPPGTAFTTPTGWWWEDFGLRSDHAEIAATNPSINELLTYDMLPHTLYLPVALR